MCDPEFHPQQHTHIHAHAHACTHTQMRVLSSQALSSTLFPESEGYLNWSWWGRHVKNGGGEFPSRQQKGLGMYSYVCMNKHWSREAGGAKEHRTGGPRVCESHPGTKPGSAQPHPGLLFICYWLIPLARAAFTVAFVKKKKRQSSHCDLSLVPVCEDRGRTQALASNSVYPH